MKPLFSSLSEIQRELAAGTTSCRQLVEYYLDNIGQRNADFVLEFLRTERIPVIAADLEDTCPRKVAYFPRTGVVRMKRLVDAGSREIVQREQRYKAQFSQAPVAGEVELFG